MNKKEIIEILEKYNLDKNQIYIISGSAMVLNDIKEKTDDIDIIVTPQYNQYLLDNYECKLERKIIDNNQEYPVYFIDEVINFSVHYYKKIEYEKKYGYNVQKVGDILKLKQSINRKKDKKDTDLIYKYINRKNINSLSLAYLGDAVYELYIRTHLLSKNKKVNELQKEAVNYVSAKAQSRFLDKMLEKNFLKEEEVNIVKRARNHKSHASKTTDIITYKKSTGLEALIGYLKINNQEERIKEIMEFIVGD